jgi:hypothetical protein
MAAHRTGLATGIALIAVVAAIPAPAAGKSGPSAPNGVYRSSWTEKELLAAGANRGYAHGNQGVLTMTLQGGRFGFKWFPPEAACRGTYSVVGTTFSIDFDDRPAPGDTASSERRGRSGTASCVSATCWPQPTRATRSTGRANPGRRSASALAPPRPSTGGATP